MVYICWRGGILDRYHARSLLLLKKLWRAIKGLFRKHEHSEPQAPIEQKPLPAMPKIALVRGHKKAAQGAESIKSESEYMYYGKVLSRVVERTENTREFLRDGTDIEGAIRNAVEWGADIIIEFHFNSYNSKAAGAEAWIYDESQRAIASKLLVDWLNFSGQSNRGIKWRERATTSTRAMYRHGVRGCLFEPFFGDNPGDYVEPQVLQRFLVEWINEKQNNKSS